MLNLEQCKEDLNLKKKILKVYKEQRFIRECYDATPRQLAIIDGFIARQRQEIKEARKAYRQAKR